MIAQLVVDRRALLLASGALGLTGCGLCAGPVPPLPPPSPTTSAIDIHCHVFNADDLPISGFLDDIYITAAPGIKRYGEEAFVALLRLIMDAQAISADAEAARINGEYAPIHATSSDQVLSDFSPQANAELLRQRVNAAAAALRGQIETLRSGASNAHSVEAAAAIQRNANDRLKLLNDLASQSPNPAHAISPGTPPPPAAVAEGAVKSFQEVTSTSELTGALWMATLMTRPRMELVHRLFALPSTDAGDVKILAPAIIDYGYWLDDRANVTPLSKQINVMSAIAAHPPAGRAVHAWVSFCPWRQIVEPEQAMLVQNAVLKQGMLGIKLYPVMGFYPIGNEPAAANGEQYPCNLEAIPNFGRKLDDALRDMYQFCSDNDVPILTHCSHSEYPYLYKCGGSVDNTVDLGLRAAPAGHWGGWERVLQEYPKLRINIGHGGGLWDLAKNPDHPPTAPLWTPKVFDLIAKYENAYADISDFSSIYDQDQASDTYILQRVKEFLDQAPNSRNKIMYGTDWEMLSITLGAEAYYPQMRKLIALELDLNAQQTSGFFGANAAKLVGLSAKNGDKPKTRQRLEAFYDEHRLDKSVLALFDE